jgi:hypothetical protein
MEEQVQKSNAGKGLGIASFVTALVAIVFSFVPCLGMYALVPGGIAIILAIIAYSQATKGNGSKGLIIAALIISIVGTAIASWQFYVWMNAKSMIENEIINSIENVDTKSLEDELNGIMNESLDSLSGTVDQMQEGLDSLPNN